VDARLLPTLAKADVDDKRLAVQPTKTINLDMVCNAKHDTHMRIERELMRGAGPVAVMRILSSGEAYGYELVKVLERQSDGVLAMGQSTLYPLLYNLQSKGLVSSRIDNSEARPRKYYRLTEKGKRQLQHETAQWQALSVAMDKLGITAS
jgi:PadR family transcriptional regulator PadR